MIAGLILIASLVLGIIKPRCGLYLIFIYIPVKWLFKNAFPLTGWFYQIYLPALTIAVLIGLWLAGRKENKSIFSEAWATFKNDGFKGLWKSMNAFDKGLIILLIWQVVNALISYLTYGKIANLLVGILVWWQAIGIYLLVRLAIRTKDELRRFFIFNLTIATLIAIIGLAQYFSGWQSPKGWVEQYDWAVKTRIISTVGNPNGLAGYLMAWLLLTLNLLSQYWQNARTRYILLGVTVVITYAILLTYSRGGWIALVGAVIYLAFTRNKRFLAFLLLFAILAGAISVQTGNNAVGSRITNIVSEEHIASSSKGGRLKTAKLTLPLLKKHGIIGVGPGMYGGTVAVNYGSPVFKEAGFIGDLKRYYLDDEILHLWSEQGIIGLVIVVFMWWQITFKKVKENRRNYILATAGALWVSFVLQGAVANVMEFPQIALMVWAIAAIAQNNQHPVT